LGARARAAPRVYAYGKGTFNIQMKFFSTVHIAPFQTHPGFSVKAKMGGFTSIKMQKNL